MPKISIVFGTRPEAIKLAPVILKLKEHPSVECHVCVTGQHREMLDQVLEVFDIKPDTDLSLMLPNQNLAGLTSRALEALDAYFRQVRPDLVLVQGDTTTVFCASLGAFYQRIPVGHVEAGLRTGNMYSPWPEEANRVLATRLASLHFAPTETNRQNLLREGVVPDRIFVTGNTVIDALFIARNRVRESHLRVSALPAGLQAANDKNLRSEDPPRIVLITGHRRENFGLGFENICHAIATLATRFPGVHFVYPVHLNPQVREPVLRILAGNQRRVESQTVNSSLLTVGSMYANIHLIEPLPYLEFVALMDLASLILTDSGGVQEEAPSLGKPVLVMRDTTERTEALSSGTVRLVGTSTKSIVDHVTELLTNHRACAKVASSHNPYGDGHAAKRIVDACLKACT